MKKILLPILAAIAVLPPFFAGAEPYEGQLVDGDYEISTLEQLQAFEEACHDFYFPNSTFILTADIDCGGGEFTTGHATVGTVFKGVFDGCNHRIYNFVNRGKSPGTGTDSVCGVGMFDLAKDGAVIRNLTLEGSFLGGAAQPPFAAAFAGRAIGAADGRYGLTLENCRFVGTVSNYLSSAALVGQAVRSTNAPDGKVLRLVDCTAEADIFTASTRTAGGLVAECTGTDATDCSFTGEVASRWILGGIVGKTVGGSFTRCDVNATVSGPGPGSWYGATNGGCGGLVGYAEDAAFRACESIADIAWDLNHNYNPSGRADEFNFTGVGGAAGVTCGNASFEGCTAEGTIAAAHGYAGGFVGWTAGHELFSGCETSVQLNPNGFASGVKTGNGGFAGCVASDGALFADCTTSAKGKAIRAGFYDVQTARKDSPVGSNTFLRCTVDGVPADMAGFCTLCWNAAFRECRVEGGAAAAGFVYTAGHDPKKSIGYAQTTPQTSLFEDCVVDGTRVRTGFVCNANTDSDGSAECNNIFRGCRAGGDFGFFANYQGGDECGFVRNAYKGSLFEDCAGYGLVTTEGENRQYAYGFAGYVGSNATVRRCVGAVLPRDYQTRGAGFAERIAFGATVEDCYSVYGPRAAGVDEGGGSAYGTVGGFIRSTTIGYREGDDPIARCFALWPLPEPASGKYYSGAFCGVTPYSTSTNYFRDCYRPAESAIDDCHDADADGVDALYAADFASATAATMPNYDFANTWRAPSNGASSPYLAASVDGNGDFWTLAAVVGGNGRILIDGEEPKEAYPAGAVLAIEAIPDNPALPFTGWLGDNIADPTARVTTYTVRNVGAFAATFGTPIYTVDDWTNKLSGVTAPNDTYALMADLDFTEWLSTNDWAFLRVNNFKGKFFGQGHVIRGLDWSEVNIQSCGAIFDALSAGAEIRDLTVVSTVTGKTGRLGNAAGLAASVGSGVLVSNCHAVVDYKGVYSEWADNNALRACEYYGLVANAGGSDIRIVDCSVEGTIAGATAACGFIGSADLNGGEIARCAVYADVSTLTNRTGGEACGFARRLDLEGGATVRECFTAGVVDSMLAASGFAHEIELGDNESSVHDCYSTAEVIQRSASWNDYGHAAGFAYYLRDGNPTGGVTFANCWFGGTARAPYDEYCHAYGFARSLEGDVTLQNCAFVKSDELDMAGTAGVAEIAKDARLDTGSWGGFDFENVWSMTAGKTTPYFAWSLADGNGFRVFAMDEEPGTAISHAETAAAGTYSAVSGETTEALAVDRWTGAAGYADATAPETAFLADNHRTLRCTWKAADPPSPDVKQAVTFDGNGGTPGIQGPTNYVVGGKYDPLAPAPVREDYDFLGWFPLPEGGEAVTTNTTVSQLAACTFYAQWTPTPKPDLAFRPAPAWPAAAFVATEAGSTVAAAEVWTRTTNYLNAAYENAGNGDAAAHAVSATVKNAADGTIVKSWTWDRGALAAGRSAAIADQAFTVSTAGVYTVTVTLDSGNVLDERGEGNNVFTFDFTAKLKQTVLFDGNGGSPAYQVGTYTAGAPYGTLPVPTRAGHDFAGWWTAENGGEQVTAESIAPAYAQRLLHAHWTARPKANLSYFVPDGWSDFAFLATEEGSLAAVTNIGVGETFYLNVAYRNAGNLDAPEHAVLARLRNSAGTVLTNRFVPCEALAAGAAAAVTNVDFLIEEPGDYTFTLALDPEGQVAESDEGDNVRGFHFSVVLPGIDVAFDAAGGSCATASRRYDLGGAYGWLPTATRTGYAFGGWWTEANGGGTRVTEESEVLPGVTELYAKWTAKKYTVKFDRNGGTLPAGKKMANQTMTYGTAAALRKNVFVRKGWIFAGWARSKADAKKGAIAYTNGQKVKNLRSDTGTVTLYAVWAKKNYTIAFNANGGTGTMAKQTMTWNKAAKLRKNAFKRKDCVFIGWAKTKTGKVAYKNAQAVKNLRIDGKTTTLYAKWAKSKYKVAFNANSGKGTMAAQAMTYGKAAALRKNAFKKSGSSFAGWAKTKTGKVVYKNGQSVKNLLANGKTLTLYAVWTANGGGKGVQDGGEPDAVSAMAADEPWVLVTTSDKSDGAAVADEDETTAWSPETAGGSWVVLSFADVLDVADVEVAGENLPEGTIILLSEDADDWQETVPAKAQYVWVLFPAAEEPPVVREIRIVEE